MDHDYGGHYDIIFEYYFLENVGRYRFLPEGGSLPSTLWPLSRPSVVGLDVAAEEGLFEDESVV